MGFAATAPLVLLLLLVVLQCASVIWQREIAAELLRTCVATAARNSANKLNAEKTFNIRLQQTGMTAQSFVWKSISASTASLVGAVAGVEIAGPLAATSITVSAWSTNE